MTRSNHGKHWGESKAQFFAKMRTKPSRLPEWVVESDRLTNELRSTRVMLTRVRRAHLILTPEQRQAASSQFDLTVAALVAHIEIVEAQLNAARCGRAI